jgi:hypothetical protein
MRQEMIIMAIASLWKHEYRILRDYIAANPGIHIDRHEVFIPEEVRDGFYTCFDNVRRAMVISWNGSFPYDAHSLAKQYTETEYELSRIVHLDIKLPLDLSSFLHNPDEGMMRLVYTRLFELVQGRITEDSFERMAESELTASATRMFRIGYEAWAALGLILLLEPDEIFRVALDDNYEPCVAEIGEIAFGRQFHHAAKRIPEFIVHSRKLDTCVAFKMPLAREVNSFNIPVEIPTRKLLRNRTGDTSSVLDDRMIFLSVVADLKRPPLFVDLHKRIINGPDLTIEVATKHDLSDNEVIRQLQTRVEIMKPRRGATVALMDPESKTGSFKINEKVEVFSVGLDQSELQPIIDKLS